MGRASVDIEKTTAVIFRLIVITFVLTLGAITAFAIMIIVLLSQAIGSQITYTTPSTNLPSHTSFVPSH